MRCFRAGYGGADRLRSCAWTGSILFLGCRMVNALLNLAIFLIRALAALLLKVLLVSESWPQ